MKILLMRHFSGLCPGPSQDLEELAALYVLYRKKLQHFLLNTFVFFYFYPSPLQGFTPGPLFLDPSCYW